MLTSRHQTVNERGASTACFFKVLPWEQKERRLSFARTKRQAKDTFIGHFDSARDFFFRSRKLVPRSEIYLRMVPGFFLLASFWQSPKTRARNSLTRDNWRKRRACFSHDASNLSSSTRTFLATSQLADSRMLEKHSSWPKTSKTEFFPRR